MACERLEPEDCKAFARIDVCSITQHAIVLAKPTAETALRQLPKKVIYSGIALGAILACAWLFVAGVVLHMAWQGKAQKNGWVVLAGLTFHIVDVVLDLIVNAKFYVLGLFTFMGFSLAFILFPPVLNWLYSLMLISGGPGFKDRVEGTGLDNYPVLFIFLDMILNILQLRIFLDAYNSIVKGEKTSNMAVAKMLESSFESFPSTCLQVYAALCCLRAEGSERLVLFFSVAAGLLSLAYGFVDMDLWSQKNASASTRLWKFAYRLVELTSRIFSLALFAYIMRPVGADIHTQAQRWVFVVLGVEFCVWIVFTLKSGIVQATSLTDVGLTIFVGLGLMVAAPPPHLDPKMAEAQTSYYLVRFGLIGCLCGIASWTAWHAPTKWDYLATHPEYSIAALSASAIMVIMFMWDRMNQAVSEPAEYAQVE